MANRVLVVDDRSVMVEIASEIFAEDDLVLNSVDSGENAIEFVKCNEVDVVITDVMMPGIDGTQLFFELKELNPFVQIIVMTAYPSAETVTQMIKHGATDFLLKPFDPEELRQPVLDAFKKLKRWKQLRSECV